MQNNFVKNFTRCKFYLGRLQIAHRKRQRGYELTPLAGSALLALRSSLKRMDHKNDSPTQPVPPDTGSTSTPSTLDPSGPNSSSQLCVEVLETLVNRAFDRAKRWAGAVLILQGFLFVAAVLANFWPALTLSYPWAAVPIALVAAWVSLRSSSFKSMAESAKRQHEYVSAFNVKPSATQLADLRQTLKKELSPEASALLKAGITYASQEPPGPKRALENLSESAWFTKHLADRSMYWVAGTFVITFVIGLALLLWATMNAAGAEGGSVAARSIAATFTFLISVGSLKSWAGYFKLSQKAEKVDNEATGLIKGQPTLFDVQKLLAEYQVSRASAPLIPTWIWKLHRDTLNEDWKLRTTK